MYKQERSWLMVHWKRRECLHFKSVEAALFTFPLFLRQNKGGRGAVCATIISFQCLNVPQPQAETVTWGHPVLARLKPDTAPGGCRSHVRIQTVVRAIKAVVAASSFTRSAPKELICMIACFSAALPKIGTLHRQGP